MNIVFWLLIVAFLALLWLCLSSSFGKIGEAILSRWDKAKQAMSEDDSDTEGKDD